MFRLAAIVHGIRGRLARGTAASAHADKMAAGLESLADLAWRQAERAGARRRTAGLTVAFLSQGSSGRLRGARSGVSGGPSGPSRDPRTPHQRAPVPIPATSLSLHHA